MLVTRISQLTGQKHTREIDIDPILLQGYEKGEISLAALERLSANDREFIKTGIAPVEWDTLRHPDDPPECNGMCLTASDIGLFGSDVAYAHPFCEVHGEGCSGFEYSRTDGAGRPMCRKCGVYREDHP